MKASRGMGAMSPKKMPKTSKSPVLMKKGGALEEVPEDKKGLKKLPEGIRNKMGYLKDGGKVNAAGNYTKPEVRKRIVSAVKSEATQGTGAGKWSARKAQLVAKKYKAAGGGYK
jgi:hypothetical protein